MSWLLRDGDVLAAIETRRPGWAKQLEGVVLLRGPTLLTAPAPLDVAWCGWVAVDGDDRRLQVRRIAAPPAYVPLIGTRTMVVASRGSFERWRLHIGDQLEIREV